MEHLIRKFEKMGAQLTLGPEGRPRDPQGRPRLGFDIDVVTPTRGQESFLLNVGADVETHVLDFQPQDRHLLLLARNIDSGELIGKYLCGHDERHWFVAGVGRQATSVRTAKESLKPFAVRQAEKSVRPKHRQRRKNPARLRQGEWFFLPAPQFAAGGQIVLHNEPLRRGAGKPHMAEDLVRFGGARVYTSTRHPNGLSEAAYRRLLSRTPAARSWGWRVQVMNPQVFVRGAIRHPDHKTLRLPTWHRVLVNREEFTETVRFID